MSLNPKALVALGAVITEGTVTAAAQRMHRTQPVVSRLIAQLESAVGFALFRREGGRLVPTAEGLSFYRESERASSALSEIESAARNIRDGRDVPLRILAQAHVAHGLLPLALGPFCASNPGFRFAIEIRQREYISHWIANRQFDVGFAPQPVSDPGVDAEPLVKAPLCLVLPGRHPLARKQRIGIAEIAKEPIIATRPGAPIRTRLDALFAAAGMRPVVRGETATSLSACQLAGQGVGVTISDAFICNLLIADPTISIRLLHPRMDIEYSALRPSGDFPGPTVQQFIEAVRHTAREVVEAVVRHAAVSRTSRRKPE
jgi:DNA-binding transcriptional LysR family regulator